MTPPKRLRALRRVCPKINPVQSCWPGRRGFWSTLGKLGGARLDLHQHAELVLCTFHVVADAAEVGRPHRAAHAADAWARLNPGKIGVAIVTAGPGVTDAVTGIAKYGLSSSGIIYSTASYWNGILGSSFVVSGDGSRAFYNLKGERRLKSYRAFTS